MMKGNNKPKSCYFQVINACARMNAKMGWMLEETAAFELLFLASEVFQLPIYAFVVNLFRGKSRKQFMRVHIWWEA